MEVHDEDEEMKTIALLNEKGGCGKSTCAVHLAAGLAVMGKRVVLVDADSQGNAGYMLGFNDEPGLYDLVVRRAPLERVLRHVSPEVYEHPKHGVNGSLHLVVSNIETRTIPMNISSRNALKSQLVKLEGHVDFVIIDTSPTPSLMHAVIYDAIDTVLIPTKMEALHMTGMIKTLTHFNQAKRDRPSLEMGGIIPTIFRKNTLEHTETLSYLKDKYGNLVWPPIRDSILWAESSRLARPVWNHAPGSKTADYAWTMVNYAMGEFVHNEA
jgi:chromosome partitioning protein